MALGDKQVWKFSGLPKPFICITSGLVKENNIKVLWIPLAFLGCSPKAIVP